MEFIKGRMQQGYGKVGILGFAGSGKSYTAHEIARGLHKHIKSNKPVSCLETENGVDYLLPLYERDRIEIEVAKTRAFADLIPMINKAETFSDILVIDSATHYWVDIIESYRKKKNIQRLAFQDWAIVKPMWGEFTDRYLNSKLHIIMAGRAGYEYDYFENEDGKMELYKTGTKMKVEADMGYEPSLLIEMERVKDGVRKTKKGKGQADSKVKIGGAIVHRAHVLKDRNQYKSLDGCAFDNPTFENFLPHFLALNLGGEHLGVESSRDSTGLFNIEGKPQWMIDKEQKEIAIAEFFAELDKNFPNPHNAPQKRARLILGDHVFGVKTKEAVENLDGQTVKIGLEYLKFLMTKDWVIKAVTEEENPAATLEQAKAEWEQVNS